MRSLHTSPQKLPFIGEIEPSAASESGLPSFPLHTGVCDTRSPPGAVNTYSKRARVGTVKPRETLRFDGLAAYTVTLPLVP